MPSAVVASESAGRSVSLAIPAEVSAGSLPATKTMGARIQPGRPEQLVAVLLGAAHGPLVGKDAGSRAEVLQAEAHEDPGATARAAIGVLPAHLVDRDGGPAILDKDAVAAPLGHGPGRTTVVIGIARADVGGQLDADGVEGILLQQLQPSGRADDVVWRRQDVGESV